MKTFAIKDEKSLVLTDGDIIDKKSPISIDKEIKIKNYQQKEIKNH